jgi:hypothetical protein
MIETALLRFRCLLIERFVTFRHTAQLSESLSTNSIEGTPPKSPVLRQMAGAVRKDARYLFVCRQHRTTPLGDLKMEFAVSGSFAGLLAELCGRDRFMK